MTKIVQRTPENCGNSVVNKSLCHSCPIPDWAGNNATCAQCDGSAIRRVVGPALPDSLPISFPCNALIPAFRQFHSPEPVKASHREETRHSLNVLKFFDQKLQSTRKRTGNG